MSHSREIRVSRLGVVAVTLFVAGSLAASPALADKLILFKSGKTIRAKSVKDDDKGWTRLELDGGLIGVKTREIAVVQDASGGSGTKAEALPNQALGGGGGAGFVSGGYVGGDTPSEAPPQPEEYQPPPPQEAQPNQYRGNPGLPSNVPGIRPIGALPGVPNGRGVRGGSGAAGISSGRLGGQANPGFGRPAFGNQQQQQNNNNNNGDQ